MVAALSLVMKLELPPNIPLLNMQGIDAFFASQMIGICDVQTVYLDKLSEAKENKICFKFIAKKLTGAGAH